VKRWWPHRTAAGCQELESELERAVTLAVAVSACCCPARPVVTVVMPPTASRPHLVDLLRCGHHFQVSRASLRAAVYDKTGVLIMAPWPALRGAPGLTAGCRGRRALAPAAPGGVACKWSRLAATEAGTGKGAEMAGIPGEGLRTEAKPGLAPGPVRANEPAAPAWRTAGPANGSYRLALARSARARHCSAMEVAMELARPGSFNASTGRERPAGRP
jgi:hypothetical protein